MSRSYKKNPFVTDHKCGTTKSLKRLANRTFRCDGAGDRHRQAHIAQQR